MRDENRRMWDQLNAERRKVDRLVGVVNRLWDYVGKIGGGVPPFPIAELLDSSPHTVPSHPTLNPSSTPGTVTPSLSASTSNSSNPDTPATEAGSENPNIFVTSPPNNSGPNARFNMIHSHSMHTISGTGSVGSSPTAMDFPPHIHGHGHYGVQYGHPHGLNRQHSFPSHFNPANASASRAGSPGAGPNVNGSGADNSNANGDTTMGDTSSLFDDSSTTTTSSEGRGSVKRQRMSDDDLLTMNSINHNATGDVYGNHFTHHAPTHPHTPTHNPHHLPHQHTHLSPDSHVTVKKFSTRARSDSAPLGYLGGGQGGGTLQSWAGPSGRPRSGSGMLHRGMVAPNIRGSGMGAGGMGGPGGMGGGGMGGQGAGAGGGAGGR
ncbi:hypothetical protein Moror_17042 [Moniliophthora roreri MCA 2997]|nr:hypothetical protein Moror_17042 [Moniliophthora roreri MCA 2997]